MWVVEVKETSGYRENFIYDSELEMLQSILYSCIGEEIKIGEVDLIEREYNFTVLSTNGTAEISVYKKDLNPKFIF